METSAFYYWNIMKFTAINNPPYYSIKQKKENRDGKEESIAFAKQQHVMVLKTENMYQVSIEY